MKDLITDENVLQVLRGYNRWWDTGQINDDFAKPIKRFAYFDAKKSFEHQTIRRHVILTGPRRVGKSTIMYQTINDLLTSNVPSKNILYVSFDHPLLKMSEIDRIIKVYTHNVALGENIYLFLDEIQYAHEWSGWLKTIYDNNPSFRVMATGSASPVLNDKMPESGVGRWVQIQIPTLSFYEYLELRRIDTPVLNENIKPTSLSAMSVPELHDFMGKLQPLEKHFHRYLLIGGFPEIAQSDDVSYGQRIIREDVVDKVLKRDMVSLFKVRHIDELERIFLYLCMTTGNIIEATTISNHMDITRPTALKYLEFLELANLIYTSYPVDMSGKKVLKAKPKVYLADAAIRNAVLLQGEEVLQDADQMGMIVESAVYKHVHTFYYNYNPKVGYFRDSSSQKEIDFVVMMPNAKILIEIKYREHPRIKENEAIVEWSKREGTAASLLITKNGDDYGLLDHAPIMRIPAFAFLYLLGHAEKHRSKRTV
ncbi:ATP-binding protein [Paenibacillus sp. 481]|uniref:ATP-binding protein n=1 Tax=Paenibacillus sp. 481 TaxID=2835869 RepID=UPI001E62A8E1|nr:ATP-binding protein [Paenibacillus sp. 481]UHA75476.1 ATP-binding protein [Paenibacillus sp. 481]